VRLGPHPPPREPPPGATAHQSAQTSESIAPQTACPETPARTAATSRRHPQDRHGASPR
jgi:hypothetical protein